MKRPVIPQIRAWLDAGQLEETVLGDGTFRIPDYLYVGEHDRILALEQLLLWAEDTGRQAQAAGAVEAAIDTAVLRGDPATAYDIIWTYFVIQDESGDRLPLDCARIFKTLAGLGQQPQEQAALIQDVDRRLGRLRRLADRSPA